MVQNEYVTLKILESSTDPFLEEKKKEKRKEKKEKLNFERR